MAKLLIELELTKQDIYDLAHCGLVGESSVPYGQVKKDAVKMLRVLIDDDVRDICRQAKSRRERPSSKPKKKISSKGTAR